jgi:hypothetical protein
MYEEFTRELQTSQVKLVEKRIRDWEEYVHKMSPESIQRISYNINQKGR